MTKSDAGAVTFFDYLVSLRAEIIKLISGVENSNGYFGWDTTTPNWVTKNQLERLIEKYVVLAKERGVYVVTRYSSCDNPKHPEYPTEDRYGLSITYKDKRFVWNGYQLYQGARESKCPCAKENKLNNNHVIDDFVCDPGANVDECNKISEILSDLPKALNHSGRNQTRSGVREILLRAILRINDAILPQPVEEYIASKARGNA